MTDPREKAGMGKIIPGNCLYVPTRILGLILTKGE